MRKSYIHKFSVLGINFVRRPISEPPEDKMLCFVDNGIGSGWTARDVGVFKGGKWLKPSGAKLRFVPAFWSVLDEEHHGGK